MRRLEIHRVYHAASPDAPAVGVHYVLDGVVGLVPEPRGAGTGMCWSCRRVRIGPTPPFCVTCAGDVFGEVARPDSVRADPGAGRRRRAG